VPYLIWHLCGCLPGDFRDGIPDRLRRHDAPAWRWRVDGEAPRAPAGEPRGHGSCHRTKKEWREGRLHSCPRRYPASVENTRLSAADEVFRRDSQITSPSNATTKRADRDIRPHERPETTLRRLTRPPEDARGAL